MSLQRKFINIALVDVCEFTKVGLEGLISFLGSDKLKLTRFDSMHSLFESEIIPDILIYDPFMNLDFINNIENDIYSIRMKNKNVKIYIFSTVVGYVKSIKVEGMFNKKISINDFIALLTYLLSKNPSCEIMITPLLIDVVDKSMALNHSEVFVLRGYSNNLKSKQIASYMDCDVKKIYYHRRNAMAKINSYRSLPNYNNVLRLFS